MIGLSRWIVWCWAALALAPAAALGQQGKVWVISSGAKLSAEPVKTLSIGDSSSATMPAAAKPAPKPVTAVKPASGTARVETTAVIDHTVKEGEDLKGIAMTYSVTVDAVKKQNGLTDTTVKPGQILKIPVSPARPE